MCKRAKKELSVRHGELTQRAISKIEMHKIWREGRGKKAGSQSGSHHRVEECRLFHS